LLLPSEHELLLRIIEAPEDDQLRLVLADALNARGDPLGEMITLQCALEGIRSGTRSGDHRALKRRERELLAFHRAEWHQQAAPFARELEFRRGLPEVLHTSAAALLEDGGLTVLAPIRALELTNTGGIAMGPLVALPLLSRVSALTLQTLVGAEDSALPPLPRNIRRLKLVVERLEVIESAWRAGWLDDVEHLELSVLRLDPTVLDRLHSPHLRTLVLVGALANSEQRWVPALTRLLERLPGLSLQWRTERYGEVNLRELLYRPTQRMEVVPREREPFGMPLPREVLPHSGFTLERLADGGLLVSSQVDGFAEDARLVLSLPPHRSRFTALAHLGSAVRLEAWPSRPLEVPLPPKRALHVLAQVAEALELLGTELERRGVFRFPTRLSREDIWLGADDTVKLLPPFPRLQARETALLGSPMEGVAAHPTFLCGTALLHLLTGEPPVKVPESRHWSAYEVVDVTHELEELRDRPLLPSMLSSEWKPLDSLVERCLTRDRAKQFATLGDFAKACLALLLAACVAEPCFSSTRGGNDATYALPFDSMRTSGGLQVPAAIDPWFGPD
jgi:uncharacterized protein (TIGR02996 family)